MAVELVMLPSGVVVELEESVAAVVHDGVLYERLGSRDWVAVTCEAPSRFSDVPGRSSGSGRDA